MIYPCLLDRRTYHYLVQQPLCFVEKFFTILFLQNTKHATHSRESNQTTAEQKLPNSLLIRASTVPQSYTTYAAHFVEAYEGTFARSLFAQSFTCSNQNEDHRFLPYLLLQYQVPQADQ